MNNRKIKNRVLKIRLIRYLTAIAIALIPCVVISHAQLNPVKWAISANKPIKALKAGDRAIAQLTASIENGWHIYSITQPNGGPIATRISLESRSSFKLASSIAGPKPKIKFDENFGMNVESYEGTAVFNIPIRVAVAGNDSLVLNVRFQSCNGQTCLPPKTIRLMF